MNASTVVQGYTSVPTPRAVAGYVARRAAQVVVMVGVSVLVFALVHLVPGDRSTRRWVPATTR